MSCGSHEEIIQALNKSRQMQVSRGIETAVEEGIEEMVINRYRYRGGVEEQSIRYKNRSSIYPPAVKKLLMRQELSRSIHQVSRSCRDCDVKKLKELDRQQGIEEVSSQLLKAVFREVKNTDMNAIQHATQPMIRTSYKSLKINFKYMDPKNTHTHTLNKSNRFYFSKTSQDSLVSIH